MNLKLTLVAALTAGIGTAQSAPTVNAYFPPGVIAVHMPSISWNTFAVIVDTRRFTPVIAFTDPLLSPWPMRIQSDVTTFFAWDLRPCVSGAVFLGEAGSVFTRIVPAISPGLASTAYAVVHPPTTWLPTTGDDTVWGLIFVGGGCRPAFAAVLLTVEVEP